MCKVSRGDGSVQGQQRASHHQPSVREGWPQPRAQQPQLGVWADGCETMHSRCATALTPHQECVANVTHIPLGTHAGNCAEAEAGAGVSGSGRSSGGRRSRRSAAAAATLLLPLLPLS